MTVRIAAAGWSLVISLVYLVLAIVAPGVANALVVAFIALLLAPAVTVEVWERNGDD